MLNYRDLSLIVCCGLMITGLSLGWSVQPIYNLNSPIELFILITLIVVDMIALNFFFKIAFFPKYAIRYGLEELK